MRARLFSCGLMMAASLGVGRIATPDTYQRLVCMIFTLAAIIDTFPILHSAHQLVNETGAVTAPSTSSWSHEPIGTARACYWHATITDVCTTSDSSPHTAKNHCRKPRLPTGIALRLASNRVFLVVLLTVCAHVNFWDVRSRTAQLLAGQWHDSGIVSRPVDRGLAGCRGIPAWNALQCVGRTLAMQDYHSLRGLPGVFACRPPTAARIPHQAPAAPVEK